MLWVEIVGPPVSTAYPTLTVVVAGMVAAVLRVDIVPIDPAGDVPMRRHRRGPWDGFQHRACAWRCPRVPRAAVAVLSGEEGDADACLGVGGPLFLAEEVVFRLAGLHGAGEEGHVSRAEGFVRVQVEVDASPGLLHGGGGDGGGEGVESQGVEEVELQVRAGRYAGHCCLW